MLVRAVFPALLVAGMLSIGATVAPGIAEAGAWKRCTHEGGVCKPDRYATKVRYGVTGKWTEKSVDWRSGIICSNEGFGTDPAHGTRKFCEAYYPDWEKCSPEGGRCSGLRSGEEVRYGTSAHRNFASKRVSGVTYVTCSNASFGKDPVKGSRKTCFVLR
jgi:hypothetical protein